MAEQLDLLSYSPSVRAHPQGKGLGDRYPHAPGHKARATSRDAARAMRAKAPTLRDRVLAAITAGEASADQVAFLLGQSILSIRPRVAELAAMGKIVDSGKRRLNDSRHKAIIWKVSAAATVIATADC